MMPRAPVSSVWAGVRGLSSAVEGALCHPRATARHGTAGATPGQPVAGVTVTA